MEADANVLFLECFILAEILILMLTCIYGRRVLVLNKKPDIAMVKNQYMYCLDKKVASDLRQYKKGAN